MIAHPRALYILVLGLGKKHIDLRLIYSYEQQDSLSACKGKLSLVTESCPHIRILLEQLISGSQFPYHVYKHFVLNMQYPGL